MLASLHAHCLMLTVLAPSLRVHTFCRRRSTRRQQRICELLFGRAGSRRQVQDVTSAGPLPLARDLAYGGKAPSQSDPHNTYSHAHTRTRTHTHTHTHAHTHAHKHPLQVMRTPASPAAAARRARGARARRRGAGPVGGGPRGPGCPSCLCSPPSQP